MNSFDPTLVCLVINLIGAEALPPGTCWFKFAWLR